MKAAARKTDVPSIYLQLVDSKGRKEKLDEQDSVCRIVQEIFNSFSLVLRPFLPSWEDLTNVGIFRGSKENLNQIYVDYSSIKNSPTGTILNENRSFNIKIGIQCLPASWPDKKKQASRLTNVGIISHELTHAYLRLLWGARRADPTMNIPLSGEEGALQEHFCDVIGITCRHLNPKKEREIILPWAILHFEDSEPALSSSIEASEITESQRMMRGFHKAMPQTYLRKNGWVTFNQPHTMSEWRSITKKVGKEFDKEGVHILLYPKQGFL